MYKYGFFDSKSFIEYIRIQNGNVGTRYQNDFSPATISHVNVNLRHLSIKNRRFLNGSSFDGQSSKYDHPHFDDVDVCSYVNSRFN